MQYWTEQDGLFHKVEMNIVHKLTHKAIARMAGYRVYSGWVEYPRMNPPIPWGDHWGYQDMDCEYQAPKIYDSEAEAWKACCIDNGLIALDE